ncbi:hypothetical protein DJ021_02400 [Phenylobacterium hankyongense]|uniref:Heavy-metal resistance n=1 Tax=Phenylobacterium hankyongense TaxID=1813876 RepID=A0A328AUA8_9CAUL|nr:hypothetical protein [Phenylobacterium hankyongense]RAK58732.1 hypothetical protein DJ021_02400 [Phenylobacterium hankyongense]
MTRSTLLAAAAASLLALPAAAWGQDHARPAPPAAAAAAAPGAWTLEVREDWLVGRLHRAQEENDIDGAEAERVYQEVAGLRDHLKMISGRHAITPAERAAHEARLDSVVSQIHWLHEDAFQRPW